MQIDWDIVATIASPLIALFLGAMLDRVIESRPRLLTYLGHVSSFTVGQDTDKPSTVHTHAVVLRNAGRKPATNVRLTHPFLPDFQIYPAVAHNVQTLPGGEKEIVIPTLVPQEQITVSYLYFPPVTWNQINGQIKSDEGMAKVVNVLPTRQYPLWVQRILALLLLIGLTAVIYVLVFVARALLA